LKTLTHIATLLAALAGILTLSVASTRREQRRLLDDFTFAGSEQVKTVAAALSSRLDGLDQDTRLLINLVDRSMSGREVELAIERRVWASSFQALATVVPHYRTIGLFSPDGTLGVRGLDPSENAATADFLFERSRPLARAVATTRERTLARDTLQFGDRRFFLYGAPVRDGAIVVASDAQLFLATVVSTYPSVSRLFLSDPAGVVWSGCGTAVGCRVTPLDQSPAAVRSAPSGVSQIDADAAEALSLGHAPAVRITERVESPTGTWTVALLASSKAIVEREHALLVRLVLTMFAVALAVIGIGLVVLRQQRRAATLEGRLRTTQALASARETSESLVENAPLGVLGISQDGRVVLANRFLVDRLGPIRVGAPLRDAFSEPGTAWIRDIEPWLPAQVPPNGGGAAVSREVLSTVTASPPFEVRIVPAPNPALGVQTFVLVEDRSQIRNLENQLVRAEKLITVGVLSAGIAHEIGSPLAVIRGRAEQVRRRVGDGSSAEDLGVMIVQIDHISSTIRQLLDFSRRQPIERRAVSFEVAVNQVSELLHWKLAAKSLHLKLDLDDQLAPLAADPDQLQQVLVNLLLNACDASEKGGKIRLAARPLARVGAAGEALVSVEVADDGCGIAPEHMHAVFDPFFTTKKRGDGTGLGLPIVSSIVRNHGGEIVLHSAHGKGTTVTMTWPAAASVDGAHA
jgi:signal transduction histidine kinase